MAFLGFKGNDMGLQLDPNRAGSQIRRLKYSSRLC